MRRRLFECNRRGKTKISVWMGNSYYWEENSAKGKGIKIKLKKNKLAVQTANPVLPIGYSTPQQSSSPNLFYCLTFSFPFPHAYIESSIYQRFLHQILYPNFVEVVKQEKSIIYFGVEISELCCVCFTMAFFDAAAVVTELRTTFNGGKTSSVEWRVSQLKALLKVAQYHEDEIIAALRSDLSKPELESYAHEISLMKSECKLAIKELSRWMAPQKVKTSMTTFPSSAEIVPEPLGVVLVISAWNYPFLLSLNPVIGAIAAGNCVLLKPSEVAPATSAVLLKLLHQYMDFSAVKVVEGGIPETTALLEQRWDKILYTGNGKVGRIILTAAAKHLTPVVLELGGKSPAVVDSDVNLKVAVRRIIAGKWGCNNGQACIAPDYLITTKSFAAQLIDALKSELEAMYGKDPLKSDDISRIVNINHFNRLVKLLEDDKASSHIVHGGQKDVGELKIAPTIFLDVPNDSLIMAEEIFGPLLPILTVDKVEDSISIIKSKEKPLAAYLFSNNKKLKEDFIRNISAGGLCINDTSMHVTVPTLPFGGVGGSGTGSYHGKFSFDAFSHQKAVLHRGFAPDLSTRYPPYTPRKQQLLRALINGNLIGIVRALLGLDG